MKVTGFSKTALKIGYPVLDATDDKVRKAINFVHEEARLEPLSAFQIRNSVHYGHFDKTGVLRTVLTTTTGFLGSPFSIVVHVDWIASPEIDDTPSHTASHMIEKLKEVVHKRKGKSYVITQCARTPSARSFWRGRLTTSKWADALVGMIHIYDNEFVIYTDTDNMVS